MVTFQAQFQRRAGIAAATALCLTLILAFGITSAYPFSQSPIIDKFVTTLPGLGPTGVNNYNQYIPLATKTPKVFNEIPVDSYSLGVGEFSEQMHPSLPGATTFWGYYDLLNPDHKYLAGVIVAKRGTPVLLSVTNNLPNHAIIPVDPTIMAGSGKTVGDLPLNRTVTHLHGGFTPWVSDGTPFQWYDPYGGTGVSFHNVPGTNPPRGTATYYYPMDQSARLVWYHDHAMGTTRTNAYSGIASAIVLTDDFESYLLQQKLLPDLVGIPLIIQDKSFVPSGIHAKDPGWTWGGPGSLWYPHIYEPNFFGPGVMNPTGRWDWGPTVHQLATDPPNAVGTMPLPPVSDVPEFFADTAIVNGAPYPVVNVTEGTFRLRMLNGSQARFWHLNLYQESGTTPGEPDLSKPGPTMYQIGTEGGFLPKVVAHPNGIPLPRDLVADPTGNTAMPQGPFNLLIAPAERADVLIDFTGNSGKTYILYNDSVGPFPMGDPRNDYFTNDGDQTGIGGAPNTVAGQGPNTRTVMKIVVGGGTNGFVLSGKLGALNNALQANFTGGNPVAPQQSPLLYAGGVPYAGVVNRTLTLNEDFDMYGRLIQTEGTTTSMTTDNQSLPTWGIPYESNATETPKVGSTEVWQIYNLTADTHPIHFHLVNVQVIQRQGFTGDPKVGITLQGAARGPDANETGWKETVRMNPGEVTTVIAKFDLPKVPFTVIPSTRDATIGSEYVWHCHILEHEEHDMMRPLIVTGPNALAVFPFTQTAYPKTLAVDYAIYNGVPPYTIASSSKEFPPIPAKIMKSGGEFVVPTVQQLILHNPGTVTYTITDSAGKKEVVTLKLTK